MKNMFILLIGFLLNISTLNAKDKFFGKWVIKEKITTVVGISALSDKEIKSFLGNTLEYSVSFAKYNNETCNTPTYKKTILSKNDFLTSERISLSKLDIKTNSVTVVEVLDTKGNQCPGTGGLFYIKNKDSLITVIDGTYFKLNRI
jgi:hypothetical protein